MQDSVYRLPNCRALEGDAPMLPEPWRIELFGGLRARSGDRTISRFPTQKTGALLAYLALHLDRSHTRDHLAELLWPDTDLDAARHSLRQALASLRRVLEPPGVAAGSVLLAERFSARLNPPAVVTDVAEFEMTLARARGMTDAAARAR